jgi:putative peptidoglycan lipid II flippase
VGNGLRTLAFVLLPMALGLFVFRAAIVQIFFQRGAFDPRATATTAYALEFYALGILFFGWQDFLQRCFFALQDTITPLIAAAGLMLLSFGLKVALVGPLAHGGIALGMTLAALASTSFLLWRLRHRLGTIGGRALLRSWTLSLLTAAAGTAAGYLAYQLAARVWADASSIQQALRLSVGLGVLVVVHIGLAIALGNQEGTELADRFTRRLRKQKA